MELPEHLGGHLNKVHTDRATFLYLKEKYQLASMLDIGCATGDMVEIARLRGLEAYGVDGDFTLKYHPELEPFILVHDFCDGPLTMPVMPEDRVQPIDNQALFDLAWSVEFLEHVEEKYMDNYMHSFQQCKYAVVTAAPPELAHVPHHVNCQTQEYWIEKFAEYDLLYDAFESTTIHKVSDMKKPFMQTTGMFFVNTAFSPFMTTVEENEDE